MYSLSGFSKFTKIDGILLRNEYIKPKFILLIVHKVEQLCNIEKFCIMIQ